MAEVYSFEDLIHWNALTAGWQLPGRLAVFGDPVAHSRSPQMHNPALKETGIAGQYVRLLIREEELPAALRELSRQGFLGANLTIPHKVAALGLVDRLTDSARHLRTVNTVRVEPDGTLSGHNTDGPGLSRAVEEAFGGPLGGQRILILGAGGGAGRAAAVQSALEGCPALVLANRTLAKVESVAAEIRGLRPETSVEIIDGSPESLRRALPGVDLILNASSVGMKVDDPALVPADVFLPRHRVYDMIYAPERTRLLEDAAAAGASVANGLAMLLWQGVLAFEYWFDRPAPVGAMRRGLGL